LDSFRLYQFADALNRALMLAAGLDQKAQQPRFRRVTVLDLFEHTSAARLAAHIWRRRHRRTISSSSSSSSLAPHETTEDGGNTVELSKAVPASESTTNITTSPTTGAASAVSDSRRQRSSPAVKITIDLDHPEVAAIAAAHRVAGQAVII
jgi:hypothetical protein